MKLSQLSTDRALDALCELTPYISNIASDENMVAVVGKIINVDDGMNALGKGLLLVERVGEIIPALLGAHREDVYGILSVINDRTVEEIAAQTVMDTINQIRDALQDKELLSFFSSFARREQTKSSAPSADSLDSE